MSDYLFGRYAQPAWRSFSTGLEELTASPWSESQQRLLTEIISRHDANQSGRMEADEELQLTAEERQRLEEAGLGGSAWARVAYTIVPNWQLFWMADALQGTKTFPFVYVARAFVYMASYLVATLALALLLFEDRELS
jgi:hypothetical protein